jgi:hypothetical protein
MRCVRTKKTKYIRNFEMGKAAHMTSDNANSPSSVDNRDHLKLGDHHPHEELYDLEADPYELENLAGHAAYDQVRQELSAALAGWMRDTDDPLLRGPIPSPFYRKALADLGT